MPIQFDVDPPVAQLAASTAEFVRKVVIPAERECGGSVHDAPEALREALQKGAREAGVFAPHVPTRWGGHGLDLRGQAVVCEAAGYSLLGPLALNCAAPDEGNMCGALGISAADAPLARLYREVRPFRIYDGPSETHRFAIARRAVRPYRQPRTCAADRS